MPKTNLNYEGFTAGEISAELQGRVSSEIFNESVSTLENMLPTAHGPAIRRPAIVPITNGLDVLESSASKHRFIPFSVGSPHFGCAIYASAANLSLYNYAGVINSSGTGELIINGSFLNGLDAWQQITRSDLDLTYPIDFAYPSAYANVSWDNVNFAAKLTSTQPSGPQSNAQAVLIQKVNLAQNTQYSFSINTVRIQQAYASGTPPKGFARVVEVTDPNNYYPAVEASSPGVSGYVTNTLKSFDIDLNTTTSFSGTFTTPAWGANKDVWIEIQCPVAPITAPNTIIYNVNDVSLVPTSAPPPTPVSIVNPWFGQDFDLLSWTQLPGTNPRLVVVHPNVAPRLLTYDRVSGIFALTTITFTATPFGSENPAIVSNFQGRLVFATGTINPERLWFSKTFIYFDFTVGTNPNDSFTFDMNQAGKVKWMKPMDSLVIGGESGIWEIGYIDSAPFGPNNYRARKQHSVASNLNFSAETESGILYVTSSGTRLWYIDQGKNAQGKYEIDEKSFLGRHIIKSGAFRFAQLKAPESMVFVVSNSKELTSFLFDPTKVQYCGWARHPGTMVHDFAIAQDSGAEYTFALVSFTVGGVSHVVLCRFDWVGGIDKPLAVFLASPTNIISGLSNYEGNNMIAYEESTGNVQSQTVVSGSATFANNMSGNVTVGLSYTSRLISKRMANVYGPDQNAKKKFARLFVRVKSGQRPLLNGAVPPETAVFAGPSVIQDKVDDIVTSVKGHDYYGVVEVTESGGKSLSVIAIYGSATVENV